MQRRRWVIAGWVGLALIAIVFAIEWSRSNVVVPLSYALVADFDRMPADDRELEKWLVAQPGMHSHSVTIERNKNQLLVSYTLLRNLSGQPRLPDLDLKCKQLGYVGKPFRDDIRGREAEARRRGIVE